MGPAKVVPFCIKLCTCMSSVVFDDMDCHCKYDVAAVHELDDTQVYDKDGRASAEATRSTTLGRYVG